MPPYTIRYARETCIGAAACIAIAPATFTALDEENKVVLEKTAVTEAELNDHVAAAKSCPSRSIEVYDGKGKRIAP